MSRMTKWDERGWWFLDCEDKECADAEACYYCDNMRKAMAKIAEYEDMYERGQIQITEATIGCAVTNESDIISK